MIDRTTRGIQFEIIVEVLVIVDTDILRDSARQFAEREYAFSSRQASVAAEGARIDQYWQAFADLGWLGAALPEEAGGIGGSIAETCVIMEELGRAVVAEPLLACAVFAPQVLVHASSRAEATELLSQVATGKARISVAHEEDNSRGELDFAETRAISENGEYIISGRKIAALGASDSQYLIVSAQVEGELALFIVNAGADGVLLENYTGYDGLRAANIKLSDVRLPASALLSKGQTARDALQWGHDQFLMAEGAVQLGVMQQAFELTRDYLKTRKQFGKALAEFQVLQHRLADIYINIEEARALHRRCLTIAQTSKGVDATSLTKMAYRMRQAARFVAMESVQLHGGIGMTDEYIVGHCCRYLTVAGIRHGGPETQLNFLATGLAA